MSSSPLSSFGLGQKTRPGLPAFEGLLDHLDCAAVVVEARRQRVILANSKTTQLTAYTRAELNDLPLSTLFPGESVPALCRPQEAGTGPFSLALAPSRSPHKPITPVEVSASALDAEGKWVLLTMEPSEAIELRQVEQARRSRFLQGLSKLVNAPVKAGFPEALQAILEAGSELLQAPLLAVYQADGESPNLVRTSVCGPSELLPERLYPHDLASLYEPYLWVRSKRAVSSLHRAARTASLPFLASVPLGQPNASIGLLAAAGEQATPSTEALGLMQIIAASITGLLQSQARQESLAERLEQTAEQLARLTAVEDHIQDGVVVISPGLRVVSLNPSAEAILGYASREVAGQPYENILVGAENIFPPFIATEPITMHSLGNVKLYRRDGQVFLANVRSLAVTHADQLESLLVIIEDLSQEEQYRLRNQQLEQRALIGEVTAIFAHEVRNPLNNISTGLQVLASKHPEGNPEYEMINRLLQDCDRLGDLMKSVLSFVRPMEYKLEPVDLGASFRRLMERWHAHLARVNIQPVLQVEENLPLIEGDVRSLEQVWNNLINNAIQAMGKSGALTVRVRSTIPNEGSPQVEVTISDTGPGIPEENRERIFEPFFTTNRNGTGLGLAIARQIVTTHKGTISVTSIPGGTAFQVHLPTTNKRKRFELEG